MAEYDLGSDTIVVGKLFYSICHLFVGDLFARMGNFPMGTEWGGFPRGMPAATESVALHFTSLQSLDLRGRRGGGWGRGEGGGALMRRDAVEESPQPLPDERPPPPSAFLASVSSLIATLSATSSVQLL